MPGCGANSSLDVEGHSLSCRLCGRCVCVFFFPRFVESLRTLVTMLRSFTGVVFWLFVVVLGFTGVDVTVCGAFLGSDSDSSETSVLSLAFPFGSLLRFLRDQIGSLP